MSSTAPPAPVQFVLDLGSFARGPVAPAPDSNTKKEPPIPNDAEVTANLKKLREGSLKEVRVFLIQHWELITNQIPCNDRWRR